VLHAIYMFHNFHLIGFRFSQPGAQPRLKSWNSGTDLALDMLVVCSDIHVLGNSLMSAEASRMQDLASEFSKIVLGDTPDPHSGRGRPSPAPTPSPASGRAWGASAPVLRSKPWSPSTFQPCIAPPASGL